VDIDPDLKKLSEDHFLGQKLTPNKHFIAKPARAFMIDAIARKQKFDLVYIDVFNADPWIPEDLVTQDFFEQVRKVLKPNGIAGANFIISPNFTNDYSLRLDQTFRSVFPAMMHLPLYDMDAWEQNPLYMMNVLYMGYNTPLSRSGTIYTDDRNSIFWDK
jgi:spermidine synthase